MAAQQYSIPLSAYLLFLALCTTTSQAAMQWNLLDDPEAVCNDYSRAGFFLEKTGSTKWIIFLESGGLCYSAGTCNQRFFRSDVRKEFATNKDDQYYEFDPEFDLVDTWNTMKSQNRSLSKGINPFMTSINTYIKDNRSFSEVQGSDFLNGSQAGNPMFYDFNRVVIPYCSSDLWLAQDDYVAVGVNLTSSDPQKQFLDHVYIPNSSELQFTFRGQTIMRRTIVQLFEEGLSDATEVLLSGSSAGGLGIVNNVKWIISEFENMSVNANISVLLDSSWFINFRGNIRLAFDGNVESSDSQSGNSSRAGTRLFDIIESIPQCGRRTQSGSPCCISLDCVLTDEEYFPIGEIPVMIVFSLYDIFLLGDAIDQITPPGISASSEDVSSLGIDFLLTITEYGGAMNYSLLNTVSQVPKISFIATQCFQHIYFATSTLWDGILEDSSTDQLNVSLGQFTGSFKHKINGIAWEMYRYKDGKSSDSEVLDSCDTSQARTMKEAIEMWYRCQYTNDSLQFRDSCYSVHCHKYCPDKVDFLNNEPDRYPDWSIFAIIGIVAVIMVIAIAMKISFCIWSLVLNIKQDAYLDRIEQDEEESVDGVPQFPVCGLEEAVSVACLDLKYSVTYFHKKTKDERRDSTSVAFAIAQHIEQEEEVENAFSRSSTRRSSRSIRSIKNARITERMRHSIPTVNTDQSERTISLGHLGTIREENADSRVDDKSNQSNHEKDILCRQDALDSKDYLLNNMDYEEVESDSMTDHKLAYFRGERKEILKGISIYFNPGELVGVMGPSGCGKTTFLDLLTGRRRTGNVEGEIFINGIPLDRIRDEYVSFTGYVLQLATPYYEELTVRENVTLAAHMKLSKKLTWREKFERVEQVIDITGLTNVSDFVVGGMFGPGLSGGQKRRLVIALQLLTMPKVIFLDEPTSGLDATSSVELLSHLNRLADSNRTVVLTIHQPRLEIFHMFHKLILLSDGKIAYHGVPQKAFGFFAEAAVNRFLHMNLDVPKLGDHNPADIIMDMLGKPLFRHAILHHYQESVEPDLIKWAIKRARVKDFESTSIATLDSSPEGSLRRISSNPEPTAYQIQKSDFVKNDMASWFNRFAVLEARAAKRSSLTWSAYLPVIFFAYGLLLGTVYYQQDKPFLIMSGFCVYSVASALFMFPVMQHYFGKALEVYKFEHADGAGRASDIVFQGVSRFMTMAIIPVVLCSLVLYLLLVNKEFWDPIVYLQLVVIGMALNQTWIALLTSLICAVPSLAFRMSPVLSSIAGFTSGFFIPRDETHWVYRWIFFINPNYYGFSATAKILLKDINQDCESGTNFLECYLNSGGYILQRFGFDDIKPYMNIAILVLMTFLYLALAILSNWFHHTNFFIKLKTMIRSKTTFMDEKEEQLEEEEEYDDDDDDEKRSEEVQEKEPLVERKRTEGESLQSDKGSLELLNIRDTAPSPFEDDVFEPHTSPTDLNVPEDDQSSKKSTEVKKRWIRFANDSLEKKDENIELEHIHSSGNRLQRLDYRERKKRKRIQSVFLDDQEHQVFRPNASQDPKTPTSSQFANLVFNIMAQNPESTSPTPTSAGNSLKERREQFEKSIKTTQQVVKEHTEELINKPDEVLGEKMTFRDLTKKLQERMKEEKAPKLANVVGQVLEMKDKTVSAPTSFEEEDDLSFRQRNGSTTSSVPSVYRKKRRQRNDSSVLSQKLLDITKRRKHSSKSALSPTSPTPKLPTLKKMSTVSDFDHQRPKKDRLPKRNTEMSLPLSGTGETNGSSTIGIPYMENWSLSGTAALCSNVGNLGDIEEEVIAEIEDEEYLPKPLRPSHLSVPDITVSDSPSTSDKTDTSRYRKLSNPSSPS